MRFPMLMLATAIAALACEKGAPLSSNTANLTPAPAIPPTEMSRAEISRAEISQAEISAAPVSAPAVVTEPHRPVVLPRSVPAHPSTPSEGDGEPMDDVDDEEVSATDKSGAAALTNEDEAPSGTVDDPEGADIELHE